MNEHLEGDGRTLCFSLGQFNMRMRWGFITNWLKMGNSWYFFLYRPVFSFVYAVTEMSVVTIANGGKTYYGAFTDHEQKIFF